MANNYALMKKEDFFRNAKAGAEALQGTEKGRFIQEWKDITSRLKNTDFDFSKMPIVKRG